MRCAVCKRDDIATYVRNPDMSTGLRWMCRDCMEDAIRNYARLIYHAQFGKVERNKVIETYKEVCWIGHRLELIKDRKPNTAMLDDGYDYNGKELEG